jgi:RND family efflux transporter MFP subunit
MKVALIAAACTVLGFGAAYFLLPVASNGDVAATVTDTRQYSCGMHPEIVSDEPGICPICNMKLTPKRDGGTAAGTVRIDPAARQNMGLVTTAVTYQNLTRSVRTSGEVSVPDPNVHSVTLKVDGWVERLFVAEEGERVFEGQPLLEIYSPHLVTAQKELVIALNSENNASMDRLAKAARSRLQNWDISDDQLERLVESGEVKRRLIVRSPADGFVRSKSVAEGDRVSSRSVLYEIADISDVWIMANVYEQDLPYLALRQPATVALPSLPGRVFEGRVSYISPLLDNQGQVEIRLTLNNADFALKPGMYADVILESTLEGDRLVIPRAAVINSGVRQLVYVAGENESYEPRPVVTGAVGKNDLIEVVNGLSLGEAVVTSGQFLLDSETRLSEAIYAAGDHKHGSNEIADHKYHNHYNAEEIERDDPYDIHTCPMPSHSYVLNYGPAECPDCGMALVPVSETDNIPVYVCPMPECGVASRDPGVCPVCNMALKEYRPEARSDQ